MVIYVCEQIINPEGQSLKCTPNSQVSKMADTAYIYDRWRNSLQLGNETISFALHDCAVV